MYVCMYVCMYVYTYAFMHACIPENFMTSSSALLAPSPKYGLTVCTASPMSSVEEPLCSSGPTNLKNTLIAP